MKRAQAQPAYRFGRPLTEATILSRPNRFIMEVELDGRPVRCHCPSTGRIGGIVFSDVPCLLSRAEREGRKTPFTVEAISLDGPERKRKSWIGINQNRANDYIHFFLEKGMLPRIAKKGASIEREKRLGRSRIDFVAGDSYLEVKTPLISLPATPASAVKRRKPGRFDSFDRLIKHFGELSSQVGRGKRAVLILCYMYDAPPFSPPPLAKDNKRIIRAARLATRKGLEHWQVNLRMTKRGVELIRYFRLKMF